MRTCVARRFTALDYLNPCYSLTMLCSSAPWSSSVSWMDCSGSVCCAHPIYVAQQGFYVICAVRFWACLSPMSYVSLARAWQRDGRLTQGDACFFQERLTQRIQSPILTQRVTSASLRGSRFTRMLCSIALPCSQRLSAGRIRLLCFECGRCLSCAAASRRSQSCIDCKE